LRSQRTVATQGAKRGDAGGADRPGVAVGTGDCGVGFVDDEVVNGEPTLDRGLQRLGFDHRFLPALALACTQLQSALRPDQVALGLPATQAAAGGGFVDPSVVNGALDCLARGTNCGSFKPPSTWPSIRGAMTWSVNWDASNGFHFANTVKPHLSTLP